MHISPVVIIKSNYILILSLACKILVIIKCLSHCLKNPITNSHQQLEFIIVQFTVKDGHNSAFLPGINIQQWNLL